MIINKDFEGYSKKKVSLKKRMFQIFMWTVIVIVLISFVLIVGGRDPGSAPHYAKVMKIDTTIYDSRPLGVYSMITRSIRKQYDKNVLSSAEQKKFEQYVYESGREILFNYSLLFNYAKKNQLEPSIMFLRYLIQMALDGNLPQTLPDELVEFGKMQYAEMAISGQIGDVMNGTDPVSVNEISSYIELTGLKADAEFIFLNVTNFIFDKLNLSEVESFYLSNTASYVDRIAISEMTLDKDINSKEITKFLKDNGWDKTKEKYTGKYTFVTNLFLTNAEGTAKRFTVAKNLKKDEVYPSPVFEKGKYHIIKITKVPSYSELTADVQRSIRYDYVNANYKTLVAKFDALIQETANKIVETVKTAPDLKTAAAQLGLKYAKVVQISPIDLREKFTNEMEATLPYLRQNEWMEFIFTARDGAISPVMRSGDYIAVIKKITSDFSIGEEAPDGVTTMEAYSFIKHNAIQQELVSQLKKGVKMEYFTNDLAKLISE